MPSVSEQSAPFLAPAAPKDNLLDFLLALQAKGQLGFAINLWKQLLTTVPPVPDVKRYLDHISFLLLKQGDDCTGKDLLDDALAFYQLALQASDINALAIYNNAAINLRGLGRMDESIAAYRKMLEINPHHEGAQHALLFGLNYLPGLSAADLASAHDAWNKKYGAAIYRLPAHYPNEARPEKVLRIGLVSGDLWKHPVGIFLIRFLENIDRTHFVFKCYAANNYKDDLSLRIRNAVAFWDDVEPLTSEQLAQKIQADGIDILIDLSGQTAKNKIDAFARKPAPIQIGWLGYPGCSGLSSMDYVIGDRFVLPEAMQKYTRAKIIHLPDSFITFDPLSTAPPVTPLPAKIPGQVTFGCFNNPAKCNDQVLRLWAEILNRLPQSRLFLKYRGFGVPSAQKMFIQKFAALGVDPARLIFEGMSVTGKMFAAMADVDLALDPFPFAGGMMTCLTLWMGIPVLTLPGESFASRQTLSFLSTIGITDTIAASAQDYCDKAFALAHNLDHLADLRRRLRPAMANSALCDGPKAAAGLQNILRKVWRDWCASQSP